MQQPGINPRLLREAAADQVFVGMVIGYYEGPIPSCKRIKRMLRQNTQARQEVLGDVRSCLSIGPWDRPYQQLDTSYRDELAAFTAGWIPVVLEAQRDTALSMVH